MDQHYLSITLRIEEAHSPIVEIANGRERSDPFRIVVGTGNKQGFDENYQRVIHAVFQAVLNSQLKTELPQMVYKETYSTSRQDWLPVYYPRRESVITFKPLADPQLADFTKAFFSIYQNRGPYSEVDAATNAVFESWQRTHIKITEYYIKHGI